MVLTDMPAFCLAKKCTQKDVAQCPVGEMSKSSGVLPMKIIVFPNSELVLCVSKKPVSVYTVEVSSLLLNSKC